MAQKLWEKSVQVNKDIERFTVGRDREMDLYLAKHDVLGSMAHITMLESIGLLTKEELEQLLAELKTIYASVERGEFIIEEGVEDVHSQVELMLTRRLGDVGKKIHSGRSRNDQVLLDLKLFNRTQIRESAEAVETLLYCYNAVEDEIARSYAPLKTKQRLNSIVGVYDFSEFGYTPVKILSVTDLNGRKVKYEIGSSYIKCDEREVFVEYEYSPSKKDLDGDCAFLPEQVTLRMLAAGTAAEYCLINGEVRLAECYECVYRQEIDGIRRRAVAELKFPPRRWV